MDNALLNRIRRLPLWQGEINVTRLGGGLTNHNFIVSDGAARYVVRLGEDIPEHQLMRFNELAASRAAHAAGLSPAVIHAEHGLTVLDYIESRTLSAPDVASPAYLERIIALMRRCHHEMPRHLRGPAMIFWVFHVIRDYAATLAAGASSYHARLDEFLAISEALEAAAAPFDIVFGHNDMLAANFLDDGARLWLIDWDYAGFNTPLFDLGGLASNNQFTEAQETRLLEIYFDAPVSAQLMHRYGAMKCASLLRETMWSMVSELTSDLDIDYAAYTAENMTRFEQSYATYQQS